MDSEGRQDERPFIRCTGCKELRKCYRGSLRKVVDDGVGNKWHHWDWWCDRCLTLLVDEATNGSENATP